MSAGWIAAAVVAALLALVVWGVWRSGEWEDD